MTPQSLGSRYLLVDKIGHGGFGTVWRARDLVTGSLCAIKVLQKEYAADPASVSRFVRERTALLRFRHPNVVTLYDMVVEGEYLALVMDLIADGDLAAYQHRRGGRLAPGEACELTAQICDALAAAHAAGIVHRDLKPSNVLLDARQVKLADFGIARIAGLGETPLTTSGTLMGTVAYVAPEMIRGEQPSAACDVYAAGVTLYELLAGKPPFTGHLSAIMYGHLQVTPERPAAVPDRLWELIAACLGKEPQARPSAANLAGSLRSLGLPHDLSPPAAAAVSDRSPAAPRAAPAPPAAAAPVPSLAETSASGPATVSAGFPAGAAHPADPSGPADGQAGRTPGPAAPRRPHTVRTVLAAAVLAIGAAAAVLISHAVSGSAGGAAKPPSPPANPRSTAAASTAPTASGQRAPSGIATATTPAAAAPLSAPAGMTATPNDDAGVSLSWTAPSPSDWYWIWYRDDTVGGAFTRYKDPDVRDTFTAYPLHVGHQYSFYVKTIGTNGLTSAASSTASVTVTLAAPSGLTVTAGDGSVRLAWRQPLPGQWYWIYMNGKRLPDPVPKTSIALGALVNGTPYTFYVTTAAPGGQGESPPSNTVTAAPRATLAATAT
jgi:Protein kinase domain